VNGDDVQKNESINREQGRKRWKAEIEIKLFEEK
jgi:hypothetical protein